MDPKFQRTWNMAMVAIGEFDEPDGPGFSKTFRPHDIYREAVICDETDGGVPMLGYYPNNKRPVDKPPDTQWLSMCLNSENSIMDDGISSKDKNANQMLTALKDACRGNNIADNLHRVSEFCEVNNFRLFFFVDRVK